MTTDQPMPGCARCRDGVAHTNHVIGEAPTPTSSLEEARREVQATQQHAGECALMKDAEAFDCTCYSRLILTLYGEIAKAAARAEVIREVEALFEKYGKPDHGDWCSRIQAWNPRNRICDCGLDDALRVLSQGGEGKA